MYVITLFPSPFPPHSHHSYTLATAEFSGCAHRLGGSERARARGARGRGRCGAPSSSSCCLCVRLHRPRVPHRRDGKPGFAAGGVCIGGAGVVDVPPCGRRVDRGRDILAGQGAHASVLVGMIILGTPYYAWYVICYCVAVCNLKSSSLWTLLPEIKSHTRALMRLSS